MGSTRVARASARELKQRIKEAGQRKEHLERYLQKLHESYASGKITHDFYLETLHTYRDGKNIHAWINHYENYINRCEGLLKEHQKDIRKGRFPIILFSAIVLFFIFISLSNFQPSFTGFFVQETAVQEIITQANATIDTVQKQAILN